MQFTSGTKHALAVRTVFAGSIAEELCFTLRHFHQSDIDNTKKKYPAIIGVPESIQACFTNSIPYPFLGIILDTHLSRPGYAYMRTSLPGLPIPKRTPLESDDATRGRTQQLITGLSCVQWPRSAQDWGQRRQNCNWPSSSVTRSVLATSCIVITRPHPFTDQQESECQIIFPEAEQILAHALTPAMKSCFSLFKILIDFHTRQLKSRLTTTHLKTILFETCEYLPTDSWERDRTGCLLHLMNRLQDQVNAGKISNYFIPANNMIDHFPPGDLQALASKIVAVREFPLVAILFLVEAHGITHTELLDPVFDDIAIHGCCRRTSRAIQNVVGASLIECAKCYMTSGNFSAACRVIRDAYNEQLTEESDKKSADKVPGMEFFQQALLYIDEKLRPTFMYYVDKELGTNLTEGMNVDVVTMKDVIGEMAAGNHGDVFVGPQSMNDVITMMQFLDNYSYMQFTQKRFEDSAQFLRSAIDKGKAYLRGKVTVNEYKSRTFWKNGKEYKVTEHAIHSEIVICCFHLKICYLAIGQLGLFQEYIQDYEDSCEKSGGSVECYKDIGAVWRLLGNLEKADAVERKLSRWRNETQHSQYGTQTDLD